VQRFTIRRLALEQPPQRINGQKKYLGDYGTQASRDEYDRLVGEWIAAGRRDQLRSSAQG
jgi:hypothetical protein